MPDEVWVRLPTRRRRPARRRPRFPARTAGRRRAAPLRVHVDLGWLARSRVGYGASLDARAAPVSAPVRRVPSSSLPRRAFSRSSSATLPSRSRHTARSSRRLARRALDELQAILRDSASSRPSPAASSSSWPWVKPVVIHYSGDPPRSSSSGCSISGCEASVNSLNSPVTHPRGSAHALRPAAPACGWRWSPSSSKMSVSPEIPRR